MTQAPPPGLLLFAHGARDPLWARPFEAVAAQCRLARHEASADSSTVVLGFLEFMQPGLVEAGHRLIAQGCRQVVVVPLFLGAGGHVRKDIPVLLAELRTAYPTVKFSLQATVGESPVVVAAMAQVALAQADAASANFAAPEADR